VQEEHDGPVAARVLVVEAEGVIGLDERHGGVSLVG
jgi:hypothetical protein